MNTKKHLLIALACSVYFAGIASAALSTGDMRSLPKETYDIISGKVKAGDATDKLIKLKKGFKIYMRGLDEDQRGYAYIMTFDTEGKLLYTERKIKFKDLPAAVQNIFQGPAPKNNNQAKPVKSKPPKGPAMDEYTIVAYAGLSAGQKIYGCSKGLFTSGGSAEKTFQELD